MKKTMMFTLTILCLALLSGFAAAGDDFVKVDKMPEMIKAVTPDYPPAAKKDGIEAVVTINAFIDKTGKVSEAKADECSQLNMGFEKAAIDAALKCAYKPAMQGNQPIGVWVSYKVVFKLDDKK